MARCFLFKPDGIGDFFLSSGVVRCLAREYGEDNLTIAALPVMEPVVRGQFPKATFVPLPIRKKRVILNVFAANCIRCFGVWIHLLRLRPDISVSLRHMRDYLMNVLFYSVRSPKRLVAENQLLGNGKAVRRWTERAFTALFQPEIVPYPINGEGIPRELEANRRLVERALGRDVGISEIWPDLYQVGGAPLAGTYWVCASFANGGGKDYPVEAWATLFQSLHRKGLLPTLVLTGSTGQAAQLAGFREAIAKNTPELADRIRILHPPDLQGFIDLLAGAGLVLSVDTAAAHASTALDRPTVILYSGQQYGTYGPWTRSPRQRWIFPGFPSTGTPWHSLLSPEEVERAVIEVLQVA